MRDSNSNPAGFGPSDQQAFTADWYGKYKKVILIRFIARSKVLATFIRRLRCVVTTISSPYVYYLDLRRCLLNRDISPTTIVVRNPRNSAKNRIVNPQPILYPKISPKCQTQTINPYLNIPFCN